MENIKNVIRFYNFLFVSNLIPYSTKHKSFFFSLRYFFLVTTAIYHLLSREKQLPFSESAPQVL